MHKTSNTDFVRLLILMVLAAVIFLVAFPRQVQSNLSGQTHPPTGQTVPADQTSPAGQTSPHANPEAYQISVNVGLVVLPVVVTNTKGKEVSGLGEASFHVYDDGQPQRISFFQPEDVPVTVGLVTDNSGSMGSKRAEVSAAAEQFAQFSNPRDEMFVVNFNQHVAMGLPAGVAFTHDLQQLLDAVSRTPAYGNTALYDGLAAALDHVKAGTTNRKAVIVISDGDDNASRTNLAALLKRAEASNTQIFTLGVFDDHFSGAHSGSALKRLAKVTGGMAYFPQSPAEIVGICKQIAENLRHQYTIGYVPTSPAPGGKYHAVRVTAENSGNGKLHVATRPGYSMPSDPHTEIIPPSKASL